MDSLIDKHLARLKTVKALARKHRQSNNLKFAPLTSRQKRLASQYIPEEIRAGYPRPQAIAIGLSRARRGKP